MNEEATLVYEEFEEENVAFPKRVRRERQIFVQELSITMTEFYNSMQAGKAPKLILECWKEEYLETKHIVDGKKEYAQKVIYDEEEYKIIRTFSKKNKEKIELILE